MCIRDRYLGGIQQKGINVQQVAEADASVAYKHIVLQPAFSIQNCESVKADYETPYGVVKSLSLIHI